MKALKFKPLKINPIKFKKLNKKGFMYLVTVSLILVVIITVFLISNDFTRQDQEEVYQTRIKSANDFVKNINDDIHRASYISTFRTFIALEERTSMSGSFLPSLDESFRETFFYGTINGTEAVLLDNSSFEDYLQRVKQIGRRTGLNVDINITSINITQSNPWSVDVITTAEINITDLNGLASWIYTKEYVTEVSILDLRDPLYGVYTQNKIPNTIRIFNETELVESSTNDTTNLLMMINNSYYIASNNSPSFIMRFENRTDADPNGIESVVNIQYLSDQDLEVYENRVKIDYIYFNNLAANKICDVQNVPEDTYFVITNTRIDLYEINSLNYSSSCP